MLAWSFISAAELSAFNTSKQLPLPSKYLKTKKKKKKSQNYSKLTSNISHKTVRVKVI